MSIAMLWAIAAREHSQPFFWLVRHPDAFHIPGTLRHFDARNDEFGGTGPSAA